MSSWSKKLINYLTEKYPITEENIKNIKEFTLDYQVIQEINTDIKKYIEKFKNIEVLNMCSCKLISLENLPKLPNLTKIELNDNYLTEKDLMALTKYPLLSEIYLANNKINSFDELAKLSNLRELHLLYLIQNPICKSENFRERIFKMFPRLLFLDGVGKNNEIYEDFEDENEEEDEEYENEEDNSFINDEESEKKSDDESKDIEEKENEEEENEEEEEDIEEEIENPNPAKKKKLK